MKRPLSVRINKFLWRSLGRTILAWRRLKKSAKARPLVYVGSSLLVVVVALILLWPQHSGKTASLGAANVIAYSTDAPSEAKPDPDTYKWNGKPSDPKFINLPTINASGYIVNVGIDQNKAMATPPNIYQAGWYVNSVLPGDSGLSIINGHIDGKTQPGIFKNLDKLKPNDAYTVEFGNGTTKTFKVISVSNVVVDQASSELFSQSPSVSSQLNLITCGDAFDRVSQQNQQRTIVASAFVK